MPLGPVGVPKFRRVGSLRVSRRPSGSPHNKGQRMLGPPGFVKTPHFEGAMEGGARGPLNLGSWATLASGGPGSGSPDLWVPLIWAPPLGFPKH